MAWARQVLQFAQVTLRTSAKERELRGWFTVLPFHHYKEEKLPQREVCIKYKHTWWDSGGLHM
jgi:hypothetical protein